ncbi:conserved hypothetical protein [Beggiatoa sp. PS]|nr:conserved hypothetical protein [Beggiatoa sp. PS]
MNFELQYSKLKFHVSNFDNFITFLQMNLETIPSPVMICADLTIKPLQGLLSHFGLLIVEVEKNRLIPGSFWGEPEAGLIGNSVYVRPDTPIHSVLHEAGHYICMDKQRRSTLNTNAGGNYQEENGVCYLQILLADFLPGVGKTRLWADMDTWGYSFRLGSSRAWFERDAEDARQWLLAHQLIDNNDQPIWRVREGER